MRKILLGAVAALLLAGGFVYLQSPINRSFLPSGVGITAQQMCSLTFLSGLAPERAYALYVEPLLGDANKIISYKLADQAVSASALGLYRQKAAYREGLGCTLEQGAALPAPPPRAAAFEPMEIDAAHRDAAFAPAALDAALAAAFDNAENTLAVVVLHEGRLVAERYAEGVRRETPLLGWSMTKSVTATLAGAMVQRGDITLDAPVALRCAKTPATPETLDTLLRMTGGLDLEERNDGFDATSRMLFTQADMACFAAGAEQLAAPGAQWSYMSANTVMAMRALQDQLGPDLPAQLAAIDRLVFAPLHIGSAVIEPDAAGTLVGSSYMLAAPQDWARLGQLYLDGGIAGDQRILPENWTSLVRTPTPGSDGAYGLGFWLDDPISGAYSMRGFQQQWTTIVPDAGLVIVRMGATNRGSAHMRDLVTAVIAARVSAADELAPAH